MSFFDDHDFFQTDLFVVEHEVDRSEESVAPKRSAKRDGTVRNQLGRLHQAPQTRTGSKVGFVYGAVCGLTLLVAPISGRTSAADGGTILMNLAGAVFSGIDDSVKETSDWAKGVIERTERKGPPTKVDPKDFMAAIRKLRGSKKTV